MSHENPRNVLDEKPLFAEREPFPVRQVLVAGNRGPCGGVNMALEAVSQVLDVVGGSEPVYANWDVVNNTPIMQALRMRGLESVSNDWNRVPDGAIVVFSAHGVPDSFYEVARDRQFRLVDATCQLVRRVHTLARRAEQNDRFIVYNGSHGHPETMGVLGVVRPENIALVTDVRDVEELVIPNGRDAVVYSQTTLSTTEVMEVYRRLQERFPNIEIPPRKDICYAADNRQAAVSELVAVVKALVVVGSQHSHNSKELRRIGEKANIPSFLIDGPEEIDPQWFSDATPRVGVTSGASVLEVFTETVLDWFRKHGVPIEYLPQVVPERSMTFTLPQSSIDAIRSRAAQ